MKIKVYGKVHLSGTSKKTGNKYDFIQLHTLVPQRGIDGQAAKTLFISPDIINYDAILIGKDLDVEVDFDGRIVSARPADSKF
jgi:hypothetical protein